MTYKPEIDGLRAVAVLLVLLTHMQLGATGGYIGVDIFFVISGYLITAILLGGIPTGKFGFWNFYGRRFVRLYPALLVTVVITFIIGFLLLDPFAFSNLARTAKYALGSVANLFYNKHQSYFDVDAHKQIFLHTWSLGVEWQFYLLWPLLLWLLFKIPFKSANKEKTQRIWVIGLLLLIVIVSVICSQWAVTHNNATAAYYLMPYRAFELGIGGLLVFCYDAKIKPVVGVGLTLAGLAIIFYITFAFTPATPFPGFNAFYACFAAAICMLGSKAFTRGNFLKWKPVVFFGKSSYSIYLLHWPLLVFYSYYVFRPLEMFEKVGLVLTASALGMLMYVMVETRINWRSLQKIKKGTLIGSMTMLLMIVVIISAFHYISRGSTGLRWRLAGVELNQNDYFEAGRAGYRDIDVLGAKQGQLIAVVAGDSFAHSYATGFDEFLNPLGQTIDLRTNPGCMVSGLYYRFGLTEKDKTGCIAVYNEAIEKTRKYNLPLILIQSWDNYKIHDFTSLQNEAVVQRFKQQSDYDAFILENLNDLLLKMEGRQLILVATVPYHKIGESEKECLARPNYLPNTACQKQLAMRYRVEESIVFHINTVLQAFADAHPNAYYIDPALQACPEGICTATHNAMIYDDGSHLSKYGSRLLAPQVLGEVGRIINTDDLTQLN